MKKSCITVFIFLCCLSTASWADAVSDLNLFSKNTGSGGFSQETWFMTNTSTSRRIKATVRYTDHSQTTNNTSTESYTFEPGAEKQLRIKYQNSVDTRVGPIDAQVVGAYYF